MQIDPAKTLAVIAVLAVLLLGGIYTYQNYVRQDLPLDNTGLNDTRLVGEECDDVDRDGVCDDIDQNITAQDSCPPDYFATDGQCCEDSNNNQLCDSEETGNESTQSDTDDQACSDGQFWNGTQCCDDENRDGLCD